MTQKLTYQKFIEKYGEESVKFSSYFKYSFIFSVDLTPTKNLTLYVGGSGDDIYKLDIEADKWYKVKDLDFNWASIEENDVCLEEYNNNIW